MDLDNKNILIRNRTDHQRIGDVLVDRGLVSREIVEAAFHECEITGDRLGTVLVRNGFLKYNDLVKVILEINPEDIAFEKSYDIKIPREILEEYSIVIVAQTDKKIYISSLTKEEIVRKIVKSYFPYKDIEFVSLSLNDLNSFMENLGAQTDDEDEEETDDDSMILDYLLKKAMLIGASDIHIEPRFQSYTVFYRHLGIRRIVHEGSLEQYAIVASQVKDRARMDQVETRIPQDGGFGAEFHGRMIDFRVATVPGVNGEMIVIRLLDPDKSLKSVKDLGITNIKSWKVATSYPFGLCLICGATGSGKTTTLNSTVREMDRFGKSIRTVEDPVEYRIPYVGQVNVNKIVGLDFATALKAFMRADPDVIVLGEVRDGETAELVLKAAETGHMVFATLHTGSVRGAIARLKSLGVANIELKPLLRGVLVQRLLRTLCPNCSGKGCESCMFTGYGDRTVVSENALFRSENDVERALNGDVFWPSMLEDGLLKFKEGQTTADEIYRVFQSEIDEGDESDVSEDLRPTLREVVEYKKTLSSDEEAEDHAKISEKIKEEVEEDLEKLKSEEKNEDDEDIKYVALD
ncbi:MAG: ATPase, T2SS/T4P/T4SS family [Alphaproteobacteria bacterium]|nr:ATPase, T2SS/T4P/T4SS family [Alphaproteobacteria bacterium]